MAETSRPQASWCIGYSCVWAHLTFLRVRQSLGGFDLTGARPLAVCRGVGGFIVWFCTGRTLTPTLPKARRVRHREKPSLQLNFLIIKREIELYPYANNHFAGHGAATVEMFQSVFAKW